MTNQKIPLRCKLGFHQWFSDTAFFETSLRCNNCPAVASKRADDALRFERQQWTKFSGDPDRQDKVFKAVIDFTNLQAEESIRAKDERRKRIRARFGLH